MIDRTITPEIQEIKSIEFLKPEVFDITKKVKLFAMRNVSNETFRLDLYFNAGLIRGASSIPAIVNSLLLSGTNSKTSIQINEEIDSLGGFLENDISMEHSVLSIYCLKENALKIASIVYEAVANLSFHEKEIADVLSSLKQQFLVNQQTVRNVGQRNLRKLLFASDENYSRVADLSDYENFELSAAKRFHKEFYLNGLMRMNVVGNVETDTIDALIDLFGKWTIETKPSYINEFNQTIGTHHFEVADAVQTSIRMGKFLFNKTHPDYIEYTVLNTILGDYFGSRLMSNIREDKGYTYGIGSVMMEMNGNGYHLIVTEVGKEVTEATLNEIRFEMKRLQTELVPNEELSLVKNYLIGQLLKSADGPFAMLDLFTAADMFGNTMEFYNEAIVKTRAITSERLQELAVKYFNSEEYLIVTAG